MIRSDKKLKELSEIINKDNNIDIINAISHLRNEQPFEGAISCLVSLYNKTEDIQVKKSIEGFMNDLKDQTASREIITEIKNDWNSDTICMLVASCWQSGLDYSEYAIEIANIFIQGNYVTAIESLTVIEEAASMLTIDQKDEILILIRDGNIVNLNEKRELISELTSILKR